MKEISHRLITWYKRHKRDLPWRGIDDAYRIWLSEIMLQQTQVVQGMSYYLKFTEQYPTVIDLAKAPEDEVMRLWQGLGYYSRARNLHAAAKHIHTHHKGKFPSTYEEIRALKGVGDYTAAAISSFAFGLPHAVVDGNVYRVLSRIFGIKTPVNSTQGKKEFQELADLLLDKKHPALHNNAIMEFGALHCRPVNPKCEDCPLQEKCYAFAHQQVDQLPVKDKKGSSRDRYFSYIVLLHKQQVYIRKRTGKDIWQNLYEFFLIESPERMEEQAVLKHPLLKPLGKGITCRFVSREYKHVLSHQVLHARFFVLDLTSTPHITGLQAVKVESLDDYGFPRLIGKFLHDHPLV